MKNLSQITPTIISLIHDRNIAILEVLYIVESAKRIEAVLSRNTSETCPHYELAPLKDSEPLRARIDSEMWHKIFDDLNLYPAMDKQDTKLLNTWLYGSKPPQFTVTNIKSVLEYFSTDVNHSIFDKALVNVFGNLINGNTHSQNTEFRVNSYLTIPTIYGENMYPKISLDSKEKINNMDQIIKQLYRKPFYENHLVKCIDEVLESNSVFEDDSYRIYSLTKDTIKIEFKDKGLVMRLNTIVSEWFKNNNKFELNNIITQIIHNIPAHNESAIM